MSRKTQTLRLRITEADFLSQVENLDFTATYANTHKWENLQSGDSICVETSDGHTYIAKVNDTSDEYEMPWLWIEMR